VKTKLLILFLDIPFFLFSTESFAAV